MPFIRRAASMLAAVALAAGCTEEPGDLTGPAGPDELPPVPQFAVVVQSVTELPVYDGTTISGANDINDHGQVVGSFRFNSVDLAVLWENGAMKVLKSLGGLNSGATGINNLGQVVGISQTGSGEWRPALWENGSVQDLGTLGGTPINSLASHATAINDLGQVVGISTTSTGKQHAFLWQNGIMQDLGSLGGGDYSYAADINNQGQVVGYYQNGAFEQRAFLWENGVMQDLGTLGGAHSSASAINEFGQVAGTSVTSQGEQRAFLWQNGVMQDLGPLGDDPSSTAAAALNDLGQVVGYAHPQPPQLNAFLLMDGTMYSLGAHMAVGVNNNGQAVGTYFTTAGFQRPVVWEIPIRPPADLQPGDATNTISLKGKNVAMAILSNPWFSAQNVNPATVTLGDEVGSDTPVVRDRKGKPLAVVRDVDGDGDKDLVLEFSKKEMTAKGDLTTSTTKLVLLGKRTDGRALRAVEPATVVP